MLTVAVIDNAEKWQLIVEKHVEDMKDCSLMLKLNDSIDFVDWCYHHKQLPDIALIDIEMTKMDGVQLTDFLTEHFPDVKVIAISSHTHKEAVEDMIGCGAYGYACKLYNIKNLPNAIIGVAKGNVYIDPILEIKGINRKTLMLKRRKQKQFMNESKLTLKQKAIIALYTTSASQKEIATTLSISQKTVENRIGDISGILKVTSRQAFTLNCIRNGFTKVARIFKEK